MPLSQAEIQKLLAGAQKQRGISTSGKSIDVSRREYDTWFKLAHKMYDAETGEQPKCSNPNCSDPQPARIVVEVNGHAMCRICFLEGYNGSV